MTARGTVKDVTPISVSDFDPNEELVAQVAELCRDCDRHTLIRLVARAFLLLAVTGRVRKDDDD